MAQNSPTPPPRPVASSGVTSNRTLLRWLVFLRRLPRTPGFWPIVALLAIVVITGVLRCFLIPNGLPLLVYEDEPVYLSHSMNLGLGQWHSGYFLKPPFFIISYAFTYFIGFLYSHFWTWREYADAFWADPTYVATIGRIVSVLFSGLTLYRMGRIGWRSFGWPAGLLVTLWLGLDVTHLCISPVVISDIPSLCLIAVAAWLALDVSENGKWHSYWRCALAIAVAASYKYNIFAVVFLVSAHLSFVWNRLKTEADAQNKPLSVSVLLRGLLLSLLDRRFLLALLLIPVAFLLLNPTLLTDIRSFLEGLDYERHHMLMRTTVKQTHEVVRWGVGIVPIFSRLLPKVMGWPLYLLALLGVPWTIWKYSRKSLILFSFPLLFLLVMLQFQLMNAKYLLPVIAFGYVGAAAMLGDWVRFFVERFIKRGVKTLMATGKSQGSPVTSDATAREKRPRLDRAKIAQLQQTATRNGLIALLGLGTLLAVPALLDDVQYVSIHTHRDTRELATESLQRLAKPGDLLFLEPNTITLDTHVILNGVVVTRRAVSGSLAVVPSHRTSAVHTIMQGPAHGVAALPDPPSTAPAVEATDLSGKAFIRDTGLTQLPDALSHFAALSPQFVLLNLGEAEKTRDAAGQTQYAMPYAAHADYYAALRQNYHVAGLYPPFPVSLTRNAMDTLAREQGIGPLYAAIQSNRGNRFRPGPILLLMERTAPGLR